MTLLSSQPKPCTDPNCRYPVQRPALSRILAVIKEQLAEAAARRTQCYL